MNLKKFLNSFPRRLGAFILVYLLLALVMYWVVADDWTRTAVETDTVSMGQLLPENAVVTQAFTSQMDCIESLSITPHFNTAERSGSIVLSLFEGDALLTQETVEASDLLSDAANDIPLSTPVPGVMGKSLTLSVDPQSTGLSLWAGNTMSAGKYDVNVAVGGLTVNGEAVDSSLVFTQLGHNLLQARGFFWPVAAAMLAVCAAVAVITHCQLKAGKRTVLTVVSTVCSKYQFLLSQLVSRDFRVKYKSSMLGMVWSFLNPLLTMLVYLFVFSTLFRSNVENFPVYLMSGIVLFNYFSEATSLGLNAIVGNSALITKVYMPKVIYPLSKVISSAINLCISFVPLLLVMIITGVPFHKSLLLLPVVVAFLLHDERVLPRHAVPVERGGDDAQLPHPRVLSREHHSRAVPDAVSHESHVPDYLLHAQHRHRRRIPHADHLPVLPDRLGGAAAAGPVGVPQESGQVRPAPVRRECERHGFHDQG